MSSRRLAVLWVATGLCGVVHAEPSATDKKHAGELATESQQHYKRGEFEVSVALLRQAYALYPEPNLLYNLARSLEGLNDKQGAVDAYKQYLASAAEIEDRGAIERRVTTLETELADKAAHDKPVEPKPVVVEPQPAKVIVPPPPPPPPQEGTHYAPWITAGVGAVVLGGGIGFGVIARHHHDDAVNAVTGVDAKSNQDTANRDALIANIGMIGGGALLVGGVIWGIVTHHSASDESGVHARIDLAPGSTSISLAWTFP